VDTCVVVYDKGASQPEVWPPSASDAARILGRFRAMPETEKSRKMLNMESYLRQRVDKLQEQLEKSRRDSHACETTLLLHKAIAGLGGPGIGDLSAEELAVLGNTVNTRLEEVMGAMQRFQKLGQAGEPATALQLSVASRVSPLPVPSTSGTIHTTKMVNAPKPDSQGWLNKSFGGGDAGASSSSGGLTDMLQLGNITA
jgi:hypothetical protein